MESGTPELRLAALAGVFHGDGDRKLAWSRWAPLTVVSAVAVATAIMTAMERFLL